MYVTGSWFSRTCNLGMHRAAFDKLVHTGHDHGVSRLETGSDFALITLGRADRDVAKGHFGIRLHDKHISIRTRPLNPRRVHQHHAMLLLYKEPHVDELAGKQRVVLVVERGAKPQSSGRLIDDIVECRQRTLRELFLDVAIVGIHAKSLARTYPRTDRGELVLRNGKNDADRLNLRDHYQSVGVRGVNDIAGIDEPEPGASRDRRRNFAERQVQFRVVDLALVGPDDPLGLGNESLLSRHLLFGNRVLRKKTLVARQVDFCVLQDGLITHELPFVLFQLSLVGSGIDLHQQVALLDDIAFMVEDVDQFSIHTRPYGHRIDRCYRPQAGQINADISTRRLRCHYRYRP